MIRGFYTARSGLMTHQEHMNTIANNMANVNTVGFKPMRSAFKDLIYQNINRQKGENVAMLGHGVKINKNDISMLQGALQPTEYTFDFAIIDEGGFFAVQNPVTEEIFYTRAGDFRLSNEDGTYYLVTGNNEYVLDADGSPIEVEEEEYEQIKDANGNVIATGDIINPFDPSVIGVYRFQNPWGLESKGNNNFAETGMSGPAEAIETPTLKRGYLENSAVSISDEMVNVIESQRAFSFSARMVQVADEIEQTVNSLR